MQSAEEAARHTLSALEQRGKLELPKDKDLAIQTLCQEITRINGVLESSHSQFFSLYKALLSRNKEIASLQSTLSLERESQRSLKTEFSAKLQEQQQQLAEVREVISQQAAQLEQSSEEKSKLRDVKEQAERVALSKKLETQGFEERYELIRKDFGGMVRQRDEALELAAKRDRELGDERQALRDYKVEAELKKRELHMQLLESQVDADGKAELLKILREQIKGLGLEKEQQAKQILEKEDVIQRLMKEVLAAATEKNQNGESASHSRPLYIQEGRASEAGVPIAQYKASLDSTKDAEVMLERLKLEGLVKDQEYLKLKALWAEAEDTKSVLSRQVEELREENLRYKEEDNKWLERLEQLRHTYETSIDKLCKEVQRLSEEVIKAKEREGNHKREIAELSVKLELQKDRGNHLGPGTMLPPTGGLLKLKGLSESRLLGESPVGNNHFNHPEYDLNRGDSLGLNGSSGFGVPRHGQQNTGLRTDGYKPKTADQMGERINLRLEHKGDSLVGADNHKQLDWDHLMGRIKLVGAAAGSPY